MPPKIKITKEEIVDTALNLVREAGEQALNARSIAAKLKCSTQPVFSNFETMEDLHNAVKEAAYAEYQSYLKTEMEAGKYPPYKASGMAYIQFAREELPEGEDASFFLCEELMPGYLNGITGEYAPPAGYLVNEKEAEAFDREFPYMEKKKLPGQIFEGDIR